MFALRSSLEDADFMSLALSVARLADPRPNPRVGAVVAQRSRIVSVAHHQRAGGPHAECLALQRAGRHARGGTLYVTLEPCNHHGRTGPCVEEILRAGVRRVVFGCLDPNPQVRGGGAERLRAHGVEVELGPLGEQARALIGAWQSSLVCAG